MCTIGETGRYATGYRYEVIGKSASNVRIKWENGFVQDVTLADWYANKLGYMHLVGEIRDSRYSSYEILSVNRENDTFRCRYTQTGGKTIVKSVPINSLRYPIYNTIFRRCGRTVYFRTGEDAILIDICKGLPCVLKLKDGSFASIDRTDLRDGIYAVNKMKLLGTERKELGGIPFVILNFGSVKVVKHERHYLGVFSPDKEETLRNFSRDLIGFDKLFSRRNIGDGISCCLYDVDKDDNIKICLRRDTSHIILKLSYEDYRNLHSDRIIRKYPCFYPRRSVKGKLLEVTKFLNNGKDVCVNIEDFGSVIMSYTTFKNGNMSSYVNKRDRKYKTSDQQDSCIHLVDSRSILYAIKDAGYSIDSGSLGGLI